MISLKQAVSMTPQNIKNNAKLVDIAQARSDLAFGPLGRYQEWEFVAVSPSNIPRQVIVRVFDDAGDYLPRGGSTLDRACWVHCSCEWFLFFCERALTFLGSSSIINSNGADPRITNPNMRPYLCKHLIRVVGDINRAERKRSRNAYSGMSDPKQALLTRRIAVPTMNKQTPVIGLPEHTKTGILEQTNWERRNLK